jgi:hypothetical protein
VKPAFTGGPEEQRRIDQLAGGSWRIMPKSIPGSNDAFALSAVGSRLATLARVGARRRETALATQDAVTMRHHIPALVFVVASALVVAGAVATGAGQLPAPTLVRPASRTLAPGPDGFIKRWLVLEPIAANGLTDSVVQAAVKKEYFPDQLGVLPHDGDTVTVGDATLAWHAVDTKNYNVNLYHFAYALKKPTSNVLFWVVTVLDCPQQVRGARLAVGSNAASVWWVNGREVIGIYGDRQAVIDDGVSKRLTLEKGTNIVRAAIVNGGGATDFCARILDSDDRPLTRFTVSLPDAAR